MSKNIKKVIYIITILLFIFIFYLISTTPFLSIFKLNENLFASMETLNSINTEKTFGRFVSAKFDDSINVSTGTSKEIKVDLKLFNIFTIKSFYANLDETELYVGGDIVGFSLNGDGVVIIAFGNVETKNGSLNTTKNSNLKKGDIIIEIEGEQVSSVADICRIANKDENKDKALQIKYKRNGKIEETTILSALDQNSKIYKIGLWVKDDVSGIGTLTFVKKSNNRFGALGHPICDNDTKTIYNIESGEMYPCTVLGLKKGTKGKAGELRGLFIQGKNNKIGIVDKNTEYGVFGQMTKDYSKKEVLTAGGRLYAKPGKAVIRTSVDGENAKDYEIEIVKTNYQSSDNEKSMVIKVTDKELLNKTGGIIQGMSGSPIIQNGRIIGAVTHVFINDPTKGYGVYLDWMINQ